MKQASMKQLKKESQARLATVLRSVYGSLDIICRATEDERVLETVSDFPVESLARSLRATIESAKDQCAAIIHTVNAVQFADEQDDEEDCDDDTDEDDDDQDI